MIHPTTSASPPTTRRTSSRTSSWPPTPRTLRTSTRKARPGGAEAAALAAEAAVLVAAAAIGAAMAAAVAAAEAAVLVAAVAEAAVLATAAVAADAEAAGFGAMDVAGCTLLLLVATTRPLSHASSAFAGTISSCGDSDGCRSDVATTTACAAARFYASLVLSTSLRFAPASATRSKAYGESCKSGDFARGLDWKIPGNPWSGLNRDPLRYKKGNDTAAGKLSFYLIRCYVRVHKSSAPACRRAAG
ncbi:hypothetical protein THAOC_11043 [Thalassiosira oceanica]|uniref:Uncharacterized protein n=1 Tax=Thalassiosira oceanica TaxID=159749 RepID=K0SR31_THAOC|nr:hypothetical protein THAOC_11043 [Thalassiosira oceanica]|eukprot:EJK67860.1 hypothetical protein THAOC_11043 [Thalassiosira oceanica]